MIGFQRNTIGGGEASSGSLRKQQLFYPAIESVRFASLRFVRHELAPQGLDRVCLSIDSPDLRGLVHVAVNLTKRYIISSSLARPHVHVAGVGSGHSLAIARVPSQQCSIVTQWCSHVTNSFVCGQGSPSHLYPQRLLRIAQPWYFVSDLAQDLHPDVPLGYARVRLAVLPHQLGLTVILEEG